MRGTNLRRFREGLGLTLEHFAELSGLAKSTIQKYERGEFAIPPQGMERVLEKVSTRVLRSEFRWTLLSPEGLARLADGEWHGENWTTYNSEGEAREAQEFLPERTLKEVEVRRLQTRHAFREVWLEIRLRGKGPRRATTREPCQIERKLPTDRRDRKAV